MTMAPIDASCWCITGYTFFLNILNSVSYISLWFPNHSVLKFPLWGDFWLFWENISPLLSMIMAPMNASSYYIIGYTFPLNILDSVCQKSLWFPHCFVSNFLSRAIFSHI